MKQYALIPKAEPFVLSSEDDSDGEASTSEQNSVQQQLLTLYESYAEAFPNPALQEENQERDRLLRAISAANHAVQVNPQKQKKSGLWNSLFGRSNENEKSRDNDPLDADDDDRLVYTDASNDDPTSQDFLLGTTASLDSTCIPEEAHSVARLSLVRRLRSSRCQSPPKVARTSWETAGSSCIIVHGLGCLLEFQKQPPSPNQDATSNNTMDCAGQLQYTSDQAQLLEYFDAKGHDGHLGKWGIWTPAEAVAATVGPNLLVVSWGLDVPVVFYRRVAAPADVGADEHHYIVTWEAVATVGASQLVRESLVDVFSDDGEDSALLCLTDLIPLVVEVPNHAPIVTLAVARLGGFVELVPLPPQMWYGAELPMTKKHIRPRFRKQSRGHKRKLGSRGSHGRFSAGNNVPDLSMNPNRAGGIVALKTTDYHSDILGLAAFRTSVDAALEWNPETHPDDFPPAQYVLAAHGTDNGTGHQIISFWSFSAALSPSAPGGVGFSIFSSFTEAINLGNVGPDVTLFASPTIFRHWRKPRHVELRESQSASSSFVVESGTSRITTVSLSVPIIEICFVVAMSHGPDGSIAVTRAAVLDWNGGVTLLDCTMLEKAVTNPMSDVSDEGASLVYLLADRTRTLKEFSKSMNSCTPIGISSIQWFQGPSHDSGNLALAVLTYEPCALLLLFSSLSSDSFTKALPFRITVASCYKNGCGKLSPFKKYKRTICLAIRSSSSICFCAMQELQPADVVRSLINASKYKEAITMAETLTTTQRESIKSIVETCKKRLWESELDFLALSSMIDDSFIVDVAMKAYSAKRSQQRDQEFLNDDVFLYRSVCRLSLERITRHANSSDQSKELIHGITSRLLKLGTYELLCQLLCSKPSLHRFFIDFLPVSLLDFAMYLARCGNIPPLSIIWYRHLKELCTHRLKVLSEIALCTDPRLFQHLLPVVNANTMDDIMFGYFMTGPGPDHIVEYACVFDYLNDQFHVSLHIDEADKALIMEDWKLIETIQFFKGEDISALVDWYCHRTQAMQQFASSFKLTLYFAKLALLALRNPDNAADSPLPASLLSEVVSLQQMAKGLVIVTDFISSGTIDSARSSLSLLERRNFQKMDTDDIVCMTMRCKSSTDDLLNQYNRYLLPMVKLKMPDVQIDKIYAVVDTAIQNICLRLLSDCIDGEPAVFLKAVSKSSHIIWSSRTSLCKSSRIIKNKEILLHLVVRWTEEVCRMASISEIPDQQYVVNCLWKTFESLPFSTAPHEDENSELEGKHRRLEVIRQEIILLDILTRWPSVNAFSVLQQYNSASRHESNISIECFGSTLVAWLCRMFTYQVTAFHKSVNLQKTKTLLSGLLSDIHELNQRCFGGALHLRHLFPKHLLKTFLLRRDAPLLGDFFSLVASDAVEADEIWKEVVCCLGGFEFGSATPGTNRGGIRNDIIDCLDILIKWLPKLHDKLLDMKRCHEAAYHITSVLLPGTSPPLSPGQIQEMDALSVFDYILKNISKANLVHGGNWDDLTWAKQSNDAIRNSLAVKNVSETSAAQMKNETHRYVFPLPGQALFDLAQILGLEGGPMILVKSKIVHVGLAWRLYGAAAAVCRSLIADCTISDVDSTPAVSAVSKLVTQPGFDDVLTKRELCLLVLRLPFKSLNPRLIEPFAAVLIALNSLDHRNQVSNRHGDSSLASIAKLYRDTLSNGSVDMAELFCALNCSLAGDIVDDTLLAKLSRHIVLWCAEETLRLGGSPLQSYSTRVVVALAASLVLHIRNRKCSKDCLLVLTKYVEEAVDEVPGFLNSLGHPDGMSPDLNIVKGLIGRGYSENGARRSVLAVQNVGFRDALQWAVSHSFDPGFDDPMVALRSENEADTDFEGFSYLKKVLLWVDKVMEALHDEALHSQNISKSETKARSWTATSNASEPSDINILNAPVFQNGTAPSVDGVATFNDKSSERISTQACSSITTTASLLTVSNPPAPPLTGHATSPRERLLDAATFQKGDELSPDRSMLLHVGQEAFQTAKQHRPSSSPSRTERMRLIEEGRRLLQQARSLSSDTDQRRFFSQSASTSPTSSYVNGKDSVSLVDGAKTQDTTGSAAVSTDNADEWDFDDDNIDLDDD